MKTTTRKITLVIVGLFLLTSCSMIPTVSYKELNQAYIKKTEAEAQIAKLKEDHQKELKDNSEKITNSQTKVINGQDTQLQAGADALYTIQQVTTFATSPGTLEFTRARALEGFTAMGKSPSIKEILEGQERLKQFMSAYSANDPAAIEKLRKESAELIKQNGILVATTEAAKQQVVVAQQEKLQIEQKYIADSSTAQTKLNEANNTVIDKEHQRAEAEKKARETAESFERLKKQLMIWCGIGAVLALAGAVYSPVGKGGLATIAGVLGAVTIALPFIQAWMIWILLGVVLVGVGIAVFVFLRQHNLAEVSNTNMIHAIEDTKKIEGATIDDLKANLAEWNTKYVKGKDGTLTTVTDDAVEKYIQSKLMKSGMLDAAPKEAPVTPAPTPTVS